MFEIFSLIECMQIYIVDSLVLSESCDLYFFDNHKRYSKLKLKALAYTFFK